MSNVIQYMGDIYQAQRVFKALFEQAKILLNNGKKLTLELAIQKQKRTTAQNNYYWLFCEELAQFFQEHEIYHEYETCGVKIRKHFTKETVHLDLNKPLLGVDTTTKMSIGEFCEYMTKLLIYWRDRTKGEFMMSELPDNYLERYGYKTRGHS